MPERLRPASWSRERRLRHSSRRGGPGMAVLLRFPDTHHRSLCSQNRPPGNLYRRFGCGEPPLGLSRGGRDFAPGSDRLLAGGGAGAAADADPCRDPSPRARAGALLLPLRSRPQMGCRLYYVWLGMAFAIAVSQFWTYANRVFDPRQARRLFAFIGAGGLLGAMLGGLAGRCGDPFCRDPIHVACGGGPFAEHAVVGCAHRAGARARAGCAAVRAADSATRRLEVGCARCAGPGCWR